MNKNYEDTSNDYGFYWDGDDIYDKDGNHWYYGDYTNGDTGIEPYSTYIDAVKATEDAIRDSYSKDEIADPEDYAYQLIDFAIETLSDPGKFIKEYEGFVESSRRPIKSDATDDIITQGHSDYFDTLKDLFDRFNVRYKKNYAVDGTIFLYIEPGQVEFKHPNSGEYIPLLMMKLYNDGSVYLSDKTFGGAWNEINVPLEEVFVDLDDGTYMNYLGEDKSINSSRKPVKSAFPGENSRDEYLRMQGRNMRENQATLTQGKFDDAMDNNGYFMRGFYKWGPDSHNWACEVDVNLYLVVSYATDGGGVQISLIDTSSGKKEMVDDRYVQFLNYDDVVEECINIGESIGEDFTEFFDHSLSNSRKLVKSSNLPEEVYYIVINGAKQYFEDREKAKEMAAELGVGGVYTETDPEEIEELYEVGYIGNSRKLVRSSRKITSSLKKVGSISRGHYSLFNTEKDISDNAKLFNIVDDLDSRGFTFKDDQQGWISKDNVKHNLSVDDSLTVSIYRDIQPNNRKKSQQLSRPEADENGQGEFEFNSRQIKSSLEDRLIPYLEEFAEGYSDALEKDSQIGNDFHHVYEDTFYEIFKSDYDLTDADIRKLEKAVRGIWDASSTEEGEVRDMGEMYGAPHGATSEEALKVFESRKPVKSGSHFSETDLLKSVLTNRITEEQAVRKIAIKNNCNIGYAQRIFNKLMKENKESLIKSDAEIEEIQKEFNVDGDLNSWADEYMSGSGKSNTKGGELVRAAQRILDEYYSNGNMIGHGYGNETVNPAARYIVEKTSFEGNAEIEDMLNHVVDMTDSEYNSWCKRFENDFADYLRDKGDLFNQPNDDDIADYVEDDDVEFFLNKFYVEDKNGNRYLFKNEDGMFECIDIQYAIEPSYYEEDVVNNISEIDKTEEYGSFEKDGFTYDFEASGSQNENGEYSEWKIVRVTITDQPFEIDDVLDISEIKDMGDFTFLDVNENKLEEDDFNRL